MYQILACLYIHYIICTRYWPVWIYLASYVPDIGVCIYLASYVPDIGLFENILPHIYQILVCLYISCLICTRYWPVWIYLASHVPDIGLFVYILPHMYQILACLNIYCLICTRFWPVCIVMMHQVGLSKPEGDGHTHHNTTQHIWLAAYKTLANSTSVSKETTFMFLSSWVILVSYCFPLVLCTKMEGLSHLPSRCEWYWSHTSWWEGAAEA